MSEEKRLWQAFKQENKEAFASLFRTYHKALYQYGRKMTADSESINDCIQELFFELWQRKHTLPEVASVKAYLFGALKLKLLKVKKADSRKTDLTDQEDVLFEFSHETLLTQEQESLEMNQRLVRALQKLPKRQQEAIYLKYFNQMSYEEISQIMSINYQATRNLVYLAVKALKEALILSLLYLLIETV